jgi:hypothetical protein
MSHQPMIITWSGDSSMEVSGSTPLTLVRYASRLCQIALKTDRTSSWDTSSTSTLASSPTPASRIPALLSPAALTVLFHYGRLLRPPSQLICNRLGHSLAIEHLSLYLPSHVPSAPCYLRLLMDRSCCGISIGEALCENYLPMEQ